MKRVFLVTAYAMLRISHYTFHSRIFVVIIFHQLIGRVGRGRGLGVGVGNILALLRTINYPFTYSEFVCLIIIDHELGSKKMDKR